MYVHIYCNKLLALATYAVQKSPSRASLPGTAVVSLVILDPLYLQLDAVDDLHKDFQNAFKSQCLPLFYSNF